MKAAWTPQSIEAHRAEVRRHLTEEALGAVDERARMVLTEYYMSNKTDREIAANIGLTQGRIWTLRYTALSEVLLYRLRASVVSG